MFKRFTNFTLVLVGLSALIMPTVTLAIKECGNDPLGLDCAGQAHSGLTQGDPRVIVARIINISLSLLGTISVGLIVYAGFIWMTAGGEEEKVKEAQKIIFASVIGLLIILSAYAISTYVLKNLYQATTAGAYPGPF